MKKKLLIASLALFGTIACAGAAACGHEHSYSDEWSNNETSHWHDASCDDTDKIIDEGDHIWYIEEMKAATHTQPGLDHYTCTVCNFQKNVETPALTDKHEFSSDWSRDDTNHWHSATCEHSDEVSGKVPHLGEWTTLKSSTCTTTGEQLFICTVCGYRDLVVTPVAGHTFAEEWDYDGQSHWHKSLCEHVDEVKDEGKHNFVNGICTDCNYYIGPNLSYELSEDEDYYTVTGIGKFAQRTLAIPAEYNGKPVKAIADGAFWGSSLEEVTVPYGVTSIGNNAFYGNSLLKKIYLPDTLKVIGSNAFYACTELTSITIPYGITEIADRVFYKCSKLSGVVIIGSNISSIGDAAFGWCSSLASINIPYSVKSIGESAFSECSSLVSISLPESLTNLGKGAFFNCSNLQYINLPEGLTRIEKNLFNYCSKLTSVTIPEKVTLIDDFAFSESGLTSIVIPKAVLSIGEAAFANCASLSEVEEAGSVSKVGNYAFNGCDFISKAVVSTPSNVFKAISKAKLTEVEINSGTTIPEGAFAECAELITLTIADTVTSVVSGAFDECVKLAYVTLPSSALTYIPKDKLRSVTITSGSTIAASALKDSALLSSVEIPESVTTIGASAFENCILLGNLELPENLTAIGASAFKNCEMLSSIVIPDSIETIGKDAFAGCINITRANLPASAIGSIPKASLQNVEITSGTKIPDEAFMNCYSLYSVVIADGVTSIGDYAFYGCSYLRTIVIPDSVTHIGEGAFEGCNNLYYNHDYNYVLDYLGNEVNPCRVLVKVNTYYDSSYSINHSTLIICSSAFKNCYNLNSIEIPANVIEIGASAFYGCDYLRTLSIHDSIEYIGEDAFYGTNIQTATLPLWTLSKIPNNNLQYVTVSGEGAIESNTFSSCYSLKSLEIKSGITSIGSNAFSGSTLTNITIPESVTQIGAYAFHNCSLLTRISIPLGVTEIEHDTFSGCWSLERVVLPQSLTSIGENAFSGCSNLNTMYTSLNSGLVSYNNRIPDSVNSIGENAFSGCSALMSVELPSSITVIENNTFSGCTRLEKIVVPGKVTAINNNAFYGCRNLESILIPDSVTTIGSSAFEGCSSLNSVFYGGTAIKWESVNISDNNTVLNEYSLYYYSETSPSSSGNYWHYEYGEPAKWY